MEKEKELIEFPSYSDTKIFYRYNELDEQHEFQIMVNDVKYFAYWFWFYLGKHLSIPDDKWKMIRIYAYYFDPDRKTKLVKSYKHKGSKSAETIAKLVANFIKRKVK